MLLLRWRPPALTSVRPNAAAAVFVAPPPPTKYLLAPLISTSLPRADRMVGAAVPCHCAVAAAWSTCWASERSTSCTALWAAPKSCTATPGPTTAAGGTCHRDAEVSTAPYTDAIRPMMVSGTTGCGMADAAPVAGTAPETLAEGAPGAVKNCGSGTSVSWSLPLTGVGPGPGPGPGPFASFPAVSSPED